MLAPRNKLWSTPLSVIDEAISALEINPEGYSAANFMNICSNTNTADIVFDIGAGDGRFLVIVIF
jgi:hypothetical protein